MDEKNRYVFDIETNGLVEEATTVHSLVMKNLTTGKVYSYASDKAYNTIEKGLGRMLYSDVLVGFNSIRFDLPVLFKLYPEFGKAMDKRSDPVGHLDLLVCSRLIWTDMYDRDVKHGKVPVLLRGRHSLKSWGYRLGMLKGDFADEHDFGEWTQAMQTYCERDVEITYKLWELVASKEYSTKAMALEQTFADIINQQEDNGFGFDVEAAGELYGTLVAEKEGLRKKLADEMPPREKPMKSVDHWVDQNTGLKYRTIKEAKEHGVRRDDLEEGPRKIKLTPFNPTSRQQVSELLTKRYGWKPTEYTADGHAKVDEKVLSSLPYPPAKDISKLFLIEKRIGQLAEGEQAWLRLVKEGRIHGGCNTNGAISGRVTHVRPNLATVPRVGNPYGEECRSLFIPRSGTVLCGFDASGLELRCAAHYLAAYDQGAYIETVTKGDPHTENQKAAGLSTRNQSKTFIYALIYGAGYQKLGSIALPKGSDKEQIREGKRLKRKFFANMPAFEALIEAIKTKFSTVGYLKGLDGRELRIRSEHSSVNLLFQSAGAIIMKQTLINFWKSLEDLNFIHQRDYWLVVNVHDEFQWECSEDLAPAFGERARMSLKKAGEDLGVRCPLDGEWKSGNNWAETH